jgi:hypothetical protein
MMSGLAGSLSSVSSTGIPDHGLMACSGQGTRKIHGHYFGACPIPDPDIGDQDAKCALPEPKCCQHESISSGSIVAEPTRTHPTNPPILFLCVSVATLEPSIRNRWSCAPENMRKPQSEAVKSKGSERLFAAAVLAQQFHQIVVAAERNYA